MIPGHFGYSVREGTVKPVAPEWCKIIETMFNDRVLRGGRESPGRLSRFNIAVHILQEARSGHVLLEIVPRVNREQINDELLLPVYEKDCNLFVGQVLGEIRGASVAGKGKPGEYALRYTGSDVLEFPSLVDLGIALRNLGKDIDLSELGLNLRDMKRFTRNAKPGISP